MCVWVSLCVWVWVWVCVCELFTCPYPLKVQACPPRDKRLATWSRVLGRESCHHNILDGRKEMFYLMMHSIHFIYGFYGDGKNIKSITVTFRHLCQKVLGKFI